MPVQYNGRAYNGKEFNSDNADDLQKLIDDGYKFYVTNDTHAEGTDPWSGMPNNHLEYWAFKNKNDAGRFAEVATGNIFNPDSKPNQGSVKDLLDDRLAYQQRVADRQAKDAAAAAKRRDYQNSLPQWRKTRSSLMRINNQMDYLRRQIQELQPEYDRLAGELKAALDQDGVKYDSIEQVLSRDFLK